MLKGPEKELNDAMSEQESKKTTWRNEKLELEHRKVHALPRVRILSKGAEAKYDQKQMLTDRKNQEILRSKVRQVTSAIKNGRETYSTSTYDQTTDALLWLDKSNQNINEYRRKARRGNTAKHAALQGCARLYQPTVPVQPTSRARREFSEFFTVFRFRKVLPRCLHS